MARPRTFDNERILAAAEAVFAEQSFGDTSLRQLIDRAQISPTAFYARYASREAVVEALVERVLGELYRIAGEVTLTAKSVDEGIELGVKGLVKVLGDHKVVVRIALTEGASIPAVRKALHDALSQQAALLASKIGKLHAKGKIPRAEADVLGWTLVGAIMIQVQRWAVFDELGTKKLIANLLSTAHSLLS
jgi:AcrR family transcriptional regulator